MARTIKDIFIKLAEVRARAYTLRNTEGFKYFQPPLMIQKAYNAGAKFGWKKRGEMMGALVVEAVEGKNEV